MASTSDLERRTHFTLESGLACSGHTRRRSGHIRIVLCYLREAWDQSRALLFSGAHFTLATSCVPSRGSPSSALQSTAPHGTIQHQHT